MFPLVAGCQLRDDGKIYQETWGNVSGKMGKYITRNLEMYHEKWEKMETSVRKNGKNISRRKEKYIIKKWRNM